MKEKNSEKLDKQTNQSFAETLRNMPNVGHDTDFERIDLPQDFVDDIQKGLQEENNGEVSSYKFATKGDV